jgi:hypothetical protein
MKVILFHRKENTSARCPYLAQLELGKFANASFEYTGPMEQRIQDRQKDQHVEKDGQRGRQRRPHQPQWTEYWVKKHGGGVEGDRCHAVL